MLKIAYKSKRAFPISVSIATLVKHIVLQNTALENAFTVDGQKRANFAIELIVQKRINFALGYLIGQGPKFSIILADSVYIGLSR
mmetsp:Transcript_8536/g.10801  ORF Transcript_8536/g.10801 Transcript_8536/m.10801 type:complete len:85 (-) Transcript_8536:873-1127(-)